MTESNAASNEQLIRRALSVITELVREKGRETGANIGHVLRREIPEFNPLTLGFPSLSRFLLEAADGLVVVGQKGNDRVWALGESISERDLELALGAEAEPSPETVPETGVVVTRVEFVNFRSCRNVQLNLAPSGLTVLVGPNGSGKSTVLHGISYASQVTRGKLSALFSGARDVRRLRSSGATTALELAICAGEAVELRLKAEPTEDEPNFTVSLKSGKETQSWTSPGPRPSPPLPQRPGRANRGSASMAPAFRPSWHTLPRPTPLG